MNRLNYLHLEKFNAEQKDNIEFISDVYDKNINALHGEKIGYDEWSAILTENNPDEEHFLIYYGEAPCAWLKINGLEAPDIGWISMLVVDPAFHRMGIGSYAVEAAENFLKEKGKRQIGVQTTPDNIPALRLYKKCGFRAISQNTFADIDNRVQLIKKICGS